MKAIVTLIMTALISVFLLAGCKKETGGSPKEVPQEPITVLHATDLHFLSPNLYDDSPLFQEILAAGDGKMVTYTNEITDVLIEQTIAEKPDCLVLSGDLTYNGEKDSHKELVKKLTAIEAAGIPVLVIPGNHDLNSDGAAHFHGDSYTLVDSVNQAEFTKLYRDFGYDDALSRSKSSFSYIYDTKKGYWILCVDANSQARPGSVDEATLKWVEQQLQAAQKKGIRVVSVSHQNVLVHNEMFSFGYQIYNGNALAKLYEKYNVILNLSGHMHIQHFIAAKGFAEVATSALSVYNCQYGVLSLSPTKSKYETRQLDVSTWAQKQKHSDKNLLNFKQYAAAYFDQAASKRRRRDLEEQNISDSDITTMLNYAAAVNRAYFSGRLDRLPDDPAAEALWKNQKGASFFANYLNEIRGEGKQNHCVFEISND